MQECSLKDFLAPHSIEKFFSLGLILAFFGVLTWIFYPGFHDYDLIHLCYNATSNKITFWFPPLLGLAINGLYQIGPPLAAVFVISSIGTLFASLLFLVSMWSSRYILGTVLLLLISLHPFSLMSIIQPGRDALICTALLLAVSMQCLGIRMRSRKLAAISIGFCFIALAVRPELALAILPIMIIGSQQSMIPPTESCISKIWVTTLLSSALVVLFLLLQSPIKKILSPGQPAVSGSLYYTQLRDLFLIARTQEAQLKIDGLPDSCALSVSEVQSLNDDPKGRLDEELGKIRPTECYSYRIGNAAKIEQAWRTSLLKHPISYLRGRGADLLKYLGNPGELRTFHLFTSFQYDEEVMKKCVGINHLYPIKGFYLSIVSLLQASGDTFISHGLGALLLHASCMGILLFRRGSLSVQFKCIIWAVIISGLLHLLTFTTSPAAGRRRSRCRPASAWRSR